jgi:hypothetical protein
LHDPQTTVRGPPQLSLAVNEPQFLPCREQKLESDSAVQPHTFAVPGLPPPQVLGWLHEPQLTVLPQVSVTLPQLRLPQVVDDEGDVHPQTLAVPGLPPPHVVLPVHVPQSTVRLAPQLSFAVTLPQFLPRRAQKDPSVSRVQPQKLAVPGLPPPQVLGDVQVPQLTLRLQASTTVPQLRPLQVVDVEGEVQPHTLAVPPPPQVLTPPQLPQSTVREAPQLSLAVTLPQFLPRREQKAALDSGLHPQKLGVPGFPPPQVLGDVQVPQLTLRLQASTTVPQLRPLQVVEAEGDVQPHTLGVPPPPQVLTPVQVPQLAVRGWPQLSVPVTLPQFRPRREQKAASVSRVQPHWPDVPGLPPPQVFGNEQVPQLTVRPQRSATFPHTRLPQVVAAGGEVHPQTFGTPGAPPPQVLFPEHAPQSTVRDTPQLSFAVTFPQFLPRREQKAASLSFVQPHWFGLLGLPPPQVFGATQMFGHVTFWPQLFWTGPQESPAQLVDNGSGVHPQTLSVPPPPQVWGVVHDPQVTVRDTPQLSFAVSCPQFFPLRWHRVASPSGVHPQTLGVPGLPPPQLLGLAQEPQLTVRLVPQLSVTVIVPQFLFMRPQMAASASGMQAPSH